MQGDTPRGTGFRGCALSLWLAGSPVPHGRGTAAIKDASNKSPGGRKSMRSGYRPTTVTRNDPASWETGSFAHYVPM